MLQSARKMKDLALGAQDGRIGHVQEFLFDDTHWTIRYLVAQAGNWLTGRMVLLSPHVLGKPDEAHKIMPVGITQDQVRHSPPVEADRPISRVYEEEYYRYFGWPQYWAGPYLWGPSPLPAMPPADLEGHMPFTDRLHPDVPKGDPHLRSTDEVTGYHIKARDGEIGHVEDFLYDDKDWAIRYLVVDTRNWWPGKKVLVPPAWIGGFHWEDRTLDAEVIREDIRQAPAYEPDKPITLGFEMQLARYYETDLHKA
jgi:hypothetical protein